MCAPDKKTQWAWYAPLLARASRMGVLADPTVRVDAGSALMVGAYPIMLASLVCLSPLFRLLVLLVTLISVRGMCLFCNPSPTHVHRQPHPNF